MNVLLTGATGYIGRRLMVRLLESGKNVKLRLFVTDRRQVDEPVDSKVSIIEGNTFNPSSLKDALQGIDTAYYLIHSMRAKKGDFVDLDRISATNFIEECLRAGVKRVIYLGGLGERDSLSRHIVSRQETGEILSSHSDKIEVIWFRAAIIMGAGGASYEIVKNLVQKLPVMIAPSWVRTLTQPIAVDDVIEYLFRSLKTGFGGSRIIDIGGEKLTFLDMLKKASQFYNLRRLIIPIPFFSPKISSYWLILLTPVPFRLASALVAGLKVESVVKNNLAEKFFPDIKPVSYIESLNRASAEEEEEIVSRWSDGSSAWFNSGKKSGESEKATHTSSHRKNISSLDRSRLWESIISIGGDRGWLSMNFLWNIRGVMDKFSGGPGLNRGRRKCDELRIGDSIDFWTVVDVKTEKRLLLSAQINLPGKAWLEFIITETDLIITAHFIPRGVYGRVYWYILFPFHIIIFKGMLGKIIKSSIR